MFRKTIFCLLTAALPSLSYADYNANVNSVIADVIVYDTGAILFRLENQPTSHPQCMTDFFSVDTTNADYANRMLSRLLTAKASGEVITIGYDNAGNCHNNRIRTHRIG